MERDAGEAFTREAMHAALRGFAALDEASAKHALRALRHRVLLRVMSRDLDGGAALAEVCETMSDLAELEIGAALAWAGKHLAPRFGRCRDAAGRELELVVVGMGKLGGRELNVSSDIDLVFVYAEEGETDGPRRLSAAEYFERVGKLLIGLLSEVTADGFAFRVDMRLRPHGDAGPLALSYDALEAYLVSHGREWERYAWIKARALTGGRLDELAAIVRPFVFRKYLDYGTLAAMRRLHAEVRREVARRELADHVKLGPGGIREIEFVAQALQLVRGGRDPALTARPTLEVLALLGERRLLPADAVAELSAAYVYLRKVEHRLQYLDDRQTHELPQDEDDRARIAEMAGHADWTSFARELEAHRAAVSRHFQAVFEESSVADSPLAAAWEGGHEERTRILAESGFRDAEASSRRLEAARTSQRYATLPADSRRRFDTLVPALAQAARGTPDPDATLARGLDLIEAIARRAAYLALLAENPASLERVARIIGASPWAADFVTRHPLLLDELLDDRVLYAAPDWTAFQAALDSVLALHADDVERQMNVLREQHQSQVFRLLAQDLAGRLTVERLADHLSELADRVLAVAMRLAWAQLRGAHRAAPAFAVIGYGKLGGKELGYASDLDIVFLYDDPDERAEELYARYAQRLNSWLTTRTLAGALFDTDLRLRPHGDKGLLAVSLEGFRSYQQRDAWVWEHQAITRARFCAGDAAVGAAFEAIRIEVLTRERDTAKLAADVLAMRERMHAAHPNRSALFDVKHDRGGMIDVEFIVQYLVLAHSHRHHALTANLGNIALLAIAAGLGLVPAELARRNQSAYRELRRMQHALRLAGAQYARVAPEAAREHADAVRALWQAVFGA
ncbi:MAG: bifunctional [glutamate--ammonia ligase]-adenylyl-L-tyrosine phosphorylase/[glutamate--ammonia-ligase] adenylyltransferase [Burkholderiales bacterium]